MEIFNLLATVPVFGQTYDVSLNWIAQLIRWLISSIGIVGVGIILFSLCLKFVVLPFDVYQRIAMRKQNQKMKDQQARMEKLQKQYANDKQMYNQKLMEMYRENGISMFSSCLPMILSMVIFIVAINAFNAYAQYSAIENYNAMVGAYNAGIRAYCPDIEKENIALQDGKIIIKDDADADAYIYYTMVQPAEITEVNDTTVDYVNKRLDNTATEYVIDTEKVKASALMTEIQAMVTEEVTEEDAMSQYFIGKAQDAVKVAYEDDETGLKNNTKFLWIKNIWMTDASYKHPVQTYKDFETEAKREKFRVGDEKISYSDIGKEGTIVYSEEAYNLITEKLTVQKEAANGYYILIALSIGTILLQQFVMMRSQKEQQKFSTVDGQGAQQQKMTMFMMTGMFAIFSFMYSAAFSIYMITSNIFSMLSTLIINKIVDKKLAKEDAAATVVRMDNRTLSRIEAAKNAGKASAKNARDKKVKEEKVEKQENEEKQETEQVETVETVEEVEPVETVETVEEVETEYKE